MIKRNLNKFEIRMYVIEHMGQDNLVENDNES